MEESLDKLKIYQPTISQSPNIVLLAASEGDTRALQRIMGRSSPLKFVLFSLLTQRKRHKDTGTNQWTSTVPTGIIWSTKHLKTKTFSQLMTSSRSMTKTLCILMRNHSIDFIWLRRTATEVRIKIRWSSPLEILKGLTMNIRIPSLKLWLQEATENTNLKTQ